jgi:crooked neck
MSVWCVCVQVWVSYAYFEANPCGVLVAEGELEEGETEEAHAVRVAALRDSVPDAEWLERQAAARGVYSRAFARLRDNEPDAKAEAALLLEEWLRFERACRGEAEGEQAAHVAAVERKLPKTVKKKRKLEAPDGLDMGMEEYLDYVFPDEDQAAPLAKLLAAAERWKKAQATGDAPP